jgi:hypothetical protein
MERMLIEKETHFVLYPTSSGICNKNIKEETVKKKVVSGYRLNGRAMEGMG